MSRTTSVRFSFTGLVEAEKALLAMGDAGATALREIHAATKGPSAGLKALDAAAGQVNNTFDSLKTRSGGVGAALGSLGPLGQGAAVGLGAASVAAAAVFKAFEMAATSADNLSDAASRLNVSPETLQSYRFALEEIGGSAQDADAGLESLDQRIGAVQLGLQGSKKALAVFASMGIPEDVVKSWKSGEDGLAAIADGVKNLKTEAERAKVLEALGMSAWAPAFRDGAAGLDAVALAGGRAGAVMSNEVVEGLADAKRQMEVTSQVMGTSLSTALVSLAPTFKWLMDRITDGLNGIAYLVNYFNQGMAKIEDKNTRELQSARRQRESDIKAASESIAYASGIRERMMGVDPGTKQPTGQRVDRTAVAVVTSQIENTRRRLNQSQAELERINKELEGRSDYKPIVLAAPPSIGAGYATPPSGGSSGGGARRRAGSGQARSGRSGRAAKAVKDEALEDAERLLDSFNKDFLKAEEPATKFRLAITALDEALKKLPQRAEDGRKATATLSRSFVAASIDAEDFVTDTSRILTDPKFIEALREYEQKISDARELLLNPKTVSVKLDNGTMASRKVGVDAQGYEAILKSETEALMLQAEAADRAAQAAERLREEKSKLPSVDYRDDLSRMNDQADATYEAARRAGATVQDAWRGTREELEQSNAALTLMLETSRQMPRTWEDFGQIALRVLTDIIAKAAEATWGADGEGGFGNFFSKIFESFGGGKSGGTSSSSSGKGGIVNSFASAISSLFGGGRASGGPVSKGVAYQVNEARVRPVNPARPDMEWFVPKTDGAIWNPQQLQVYQNSQAKMMADFQAQQSYMRAQGLGGAAPSVNVAPPQVNFILKNESGTPVDATQRQLADGSLEVTLRKMLRPAVRAEIGDMNRDGTLGTLQQSARKPVKRS